MGFFPVVPEEGMLQKQENDLLEIDLNCLYIKLSLFVLQLNTNMLLTFLLLNQFIHFIHVNLTSIQVYSILVNYPPRLKPLSLILILRLLSVLF